MKFHFKFSTIFLVLFFVSTAAFGQVAQNKTHIVKPNETLFSIAQKNNVTVRDLKKWNHLKNNTIHIGQSLIVEPPESLLNRHTKDSGKKSSSNSFLKTDKPGQSYYKVKSGDTLYKIALKFNMTIQRLKKLNHLKNNVLFVGQKLRVKALILAPSVVVANAKITSTPQGKFVQYKVPGRVPVSDVLKKFEMDEYTFSALNPNVTENHLYKGEKVTVLLPATVRNRNPYRINADLKHVENANATEYPDSATGKPTTSGDLYNPNALTAASPTLPLGSVIYVQNPVNKKGIFVMVNDRVITNNLKLSQKAYEELGLNDNYHRVMISEIR